LDAGSIPAASTKFNMHITYGLTDTIRVAKRLAMGGVFITVGIAFLCFMMCSPPTSVASDYHSNYEKIPAVNKNPVQAGQWRTTPTVIVCKYAPISETHIHSAVSFWRTLGHEFKLGSYNRDPLKKCIDPAPEGYIIINLVSADIELGPTALAETRFYVNNDTGNIEWAKIHMRDDVRITVLEHEIGHALGYLHYDRINHLMHSKWPQGGWDIEGLKNN